MDFYTSNTVEKSCRFELPLCRPNYMKLNGGDKRYGGALTGKLYVRLVD